MPGKPRVVVADLGCSRVIEANSSHMVSTSGAVKGTYRFLAPELARNDSERKAYSTQADVYGFAITL